MQLWVLIDQKEVVNDVYKLRQQEEGGWVLLTLMLVQKYLLIFANQDKTQTFLTKNIKQRLSEMHKLGSASSVPLPSSK